MSSGPDPNKAAVFRLLHLEQARQSSQAAFGAVRPSAVSSGSMWLNMTQCDSMWLNMAQCDSMSLNMAQYGSV
jgi:hypothetical protein